MIHQLADITGTGAKVALASTPTPVNWVKIQTNSKVHTNSSVVRVGDASVSATQGMVVDVNDSKDVNPASATNTFDLSQTFALIQTGDVIQISYNQV